jgi:hypothetical protein
MKRPWSTVSCCAMGETIVVFLSSKCGISKNEEEKTVAVSL